MHMAMRGVLASGPPLRKFSGMERQWLVLAACTALSIAMHAALLTLESLPQRRPAGATDASGARSLQLRLVPAATARPEIPESVPVGSAILPPTSLPPANVPAPSPARRLPASSPAAIARAPDASPTPEPHPAVAAPLPQPGARGDYVPRPQLSVGPKPVAAIVLESPAGEVIATRQTGVLSLFIDEEGRVQHIEAGEPALSPALQEAARAAFKGALFEPGQIDGRPVKSRLRIEASFEASFPAANLVTRPLP